MSTVQALQLLAIAVTVLGGGMHAVWRIRCRMRNESDIFKLIGFSLLFVFAALIQIVVLIATDHAQNAGSR